MDEQREAQELASKSFKTIESGRPDHIVERNDGGAADSSSIDGVIATIAGEDALAIQSKVRDVAERPAVSAPKAKKTYAASIANIGRRPVKKETTFRRFFLFVSGLFLAAIAGSFCNSFVSEVLENREFYWPQYVKAFCDAEAKVLLHQDRAFADMRKALREGEDIEPQSRRFAELTSSFAKRLDTSAFYLEAKSQWAKAAVPSDIASPEFRECKRSYLIDEAESEHLALASLMKKDVDLNLLAEVEKAASVFQNSSVAAHDGRAFRAFVVAGSLSADANDFERARRDFNSAQMIANGQWMGFGFDTESLLEARWLAQLQEDVHGFLRAKGTPVLRSQYQPAGWYASYETNHSDLKARNFDQLEKTLDDAQKSHLQDLFGYTIVTDIYSMGHAWSADDTGESHRQILREWLNARPHSARPLIAMAFSLRAKAYQMLDALGNSSPSDSTKTQVYQLLYESAQDLRRAQILQPDVAYEPSFIEAIQGNFYTAQKLSSWSYPENKLMSDLHFASIVMTGDDSQLFLSELTNDAEGLTQTPDSTELLLPRVCELADKIGGQAGDEFYTRAIIRLDRPRSPENVDLARFKRGESLLHERFGAFHDVMP